MTNSGTIHNCIEHNTYNFKNGDHATTVIGNIKGMITAILDRFGSIQYEFSYFVNGDAKSIWIRKEELLHPEHEHKKIGL